jgi:hypothetical protein
MYLLVSVADPKLFDIVPDTDRNVYSDPDPIRNTAADADIPTVSHIPVDAGISYCCGINNQTHQTIGLPVLDCFGNLTSEHRLSDWWKRVTIRLQNIRLKSCCCWRSCCPIL